MKTIRLVLALVLSLVAAACVPSSSPPKLEEANRQALETLTQQQQGSGNSHRFFAGDEIAISSLRYPELNRQLRLDIYGNFSFPYLGEIHGQGQTAAELAGRLKQGLKDAEYYQNAELTVTLVSSEHPVVYVLGEVYKPGPITLRGQTPILEVLAKAGGQTYQAELTNVIFIRSTLEPPAAVVLNLDELFKGTAKESLYSFNVMPGDILYVPSSTIADVERFLRRITNILQPALALENGIVVYPDVERVLTGRQQQNANNPTVVINNP